MKKLLALCLALIICLCAFSACDDVSGAGEAEESMILSDEDDTTGGDDTTDGEEDDSGNESEDDETEGPGAVHPLDGKKIIFIGNSHNYYGKAVLDKGTKVLTQEERSNDRGYFYQLCRSNGAEVSVTNWTFGSHGFTDLFVKCGVDSSCKGKDHLSYLTDRSFDYVVMQYGTKSEEGFLENCRMVMDVFKAANENVKFIFHVQRRAHELDYLWLSEVKELENMGVTIVDWGGLVDGLIRGDITVPGAEQTYDQNSFIVRKSADDGYSVRRGNQIIYFRDAESVHYFLSYIGAKKEAFEVINAKMLREKNNEVNRKQNFDMANLTKTVNTAGIYVDAIRALMESGDFEKLPLELRTTAQNRVDNDTLTLQELADMEEPPISKSQVSKRLQKIYHFYEENKQTEAKL